MPAKDKDNSRRRFGSIRKLPSGRIQARYRGPDGIRRDAPNTFLTEREATAWLTVIEAEILKGAWQPPEQQEIRLAVYGKRWIAERKLQPRTREAYEDLFRLHIVPILGAAPLGALTPASIRTWRSKLLANGTTEPQAVKAYSLLRAILNTAIKEDEIIRQNPCRIPGYGRYHTPERPTATVAQVLALAAQMPPRFAALVVTAAFSGARWGELVALRRADYDPANGTLRIHRKLAALKGELVFGPPKSAAGRRVVTLPAIARTALEEHLKEHVDADDEALIFTGDKGALLRTGNFRRAVKWETALKKAEMPTGFHFHDLRHTGNTLAASTGASTRELMVRMGQSSMRAALIYQHATNERDREIAEDMDKRIAKATKPKKPKKKPKRKPTAEA
ncbi:tyrosine-type recombinase/integrase [Catenuloplanes atrovinosus]|uniref:Integrase n=1 Tax=Catenuloplanes atrovinosus TaxID=137266 RepID=A0AAE3YU58_9ACTN|nr:site-specific integrase [Catenuloplanes atrovinosus]MDR7278680.1 integrase [Catenuloplanes atrovinosus]